MAFIREEEIYGKVLNKAHRLLAGRPRSERELRRRLTQEVKKLEIKRLRDKLIEEVIERLKSEGLVDDQGFVRWWVEQRVTFKPKGMRLIKEELGKKGISGELIEINKLRELIRELGTSEEEMAKREVQSQKFKVKSWSKKERRRKLAVYLTKRGFGWETIRMVVDEEEERG